MGLKTLQLKAQLQPGRRYKDGSVGINFITAEEIDTKKFAEIDSWRSQNGWLLFKPNEFTDGEIPKDDTAIDEDKPMSQRVRGALYVLHQLSGGKKEDFNTFYRERLQVYLDIIISKIEAKENGK